MAEAFGVEWLFTGTVYGLGGEISVALELWDASGTRLQRITTRGPAEGPVLSRMLRDARVGGAVAEGSPEPARIERSRWPAWVLGGASVAALAAGTAFGAASQNAAQRVSKGGTGCSGTGSEYQACFEQTLRTGEAQATTANVLFGAGALLGAGALFVFVAEWP